MAPQDVANAIFGATPDNQVRQSMLMGAQLESGMNPDSVGDSGHSYGIYQIYLPAHPDMTAAKARDIVASTLFMLPAYQQAVRRVPDGLWNLDPGLASATAAFYAERPKVMYPTQRIRSGWPIVLGVMQGARPTNNTPPPTTTGPGQASTPDTTDMPALLKVAYELFGPIVEFFASAAKLLTWFLTHMFLPKTWARVAAFLFGTVLVVSGVFVFFTGSSPVRKVTGVLP